MISIKHVLPPKLFEIVEKAELSTPKQIMILSVWDIKRLTNLHIQDIILLKNLIGEFVKPQIFTADSLHNIQRHKKLSSGCYTLDCVLGGGFRRGCITEVYGESGSGKTQLGIQTVVHNWPNCSIYICTEDLFPIRRFNRVTQSISNYNAQDDYGKNVYVEHITESQDLLICVRVKIPKLLRAKKISLIVIDSIAAPFRVENTNYVQRAEDLRSLAIMLIAIAQDFNLTVICINQVTTSLENSGESLPALGLAWTNMVSTRLCVTKSSEIIDSKILEPCQLNQNTVYYIRELSVIFSSDLPNVKAKFIITPNGIQGLL